NGNCRVFRFGGERHGEAPFECMKACDPACHRFCADLRHGFAGLRRFIKTYGKTRVGKKQPRELRKERHKFGKRYSRQNAIPDRSGEFARLQRHIEPVALNGSARFAITRPRVGDHLLADINGGSFLANVRKFGCYAEQQDTFVMSFNRMAIGRNDLIVRPQRRFQSCPTPVKPERAFLIHVSAQCRIKWCAIATGGGMRTLSVVSPARRRLARSFSSQNASAISLGSMVMSRPSASAKQPIMSDDGNGQGCVVK